MKVLSLFDGISCGRVALEQEGFCIEKYVAYEVEKNAIKVALDNYPDTVEKGDVFNAEYTEGEYDIVIGGSPCTYWSIARTNGERETTSSGFGWELFKQYARAIEEVKPKWFLYENNFSMSCAIKTEITKTLGVEPIMIDSKDFSAQNRKRYYWTNIPVELNYGGCDLVIADIMIEGKFKIKDFSKYKDTVRWSRDGMNCSWDTSGKGYYSQGSRCRKPSTKSNTLTAGGDDKNNIWVDGYICRKIQPIEAERLQGLPDNYTSILSSKPKRCSVCGNGWTVPVIRHILKGIK